MAVSHSVGQYRRYAENFRAAAFDPRRWLDVIQENGFEYLVFTAKHHDGFCMFDSRLTDFNVTRTPFGRDVFGMLAEECHRRSLPLVAYYSVVDWHHPAYPNRGRHHELVTDPARHNLAEYLEYMRGQIRELCSNYGTLHGIWWDMNTAELNDPSLNEMIRRLQPEAVINDRGCGPGDYLTSERCAPEENRGALKYEGCDSVGRFSWGFRRDEDYYSSSFFQSKVALTLARGGNFLINIGPDGDGRFPEPAEKILIEAGSWYRKVREGLTATPAPDLSTSRQPVTGEPGGDTFYWILEEPSASSRFVLPGKQFPDIAEAELLNTGEKLPDRQPPDFPGILHRTVSNRIRRAGRRRRDPRSQTPLPHPGLPAGSAGKTGSVAEFTESSMGLDEPHGAILPDGRILVLLRAGARLPGDGIPGVTSGKLYSISRDNGAHWSRPEFLRYDDGGTVYSPRSFQDLFVSRRNGKVYAVLSISPEPCWNCDPRNLLSLGEIDTETMTLKRKSIVPVEEMCPDHHPLVRFSNWQQLEDSRGRSPALHDHRRRRRLFRPGRMG
ncbi:MAG: alpha-L-fucosidase [Lentisphaeria bacterium]|nr:MAG: alpha-L-fucosidase [Lentisphaeria bacterium]